MSDNKSFIEHGGDIYTQGIFNGIKLLDFSSNINFLGLPSSFKNSISENLEQLTQYPDLKYRQAKQHISQYLKHEIKQENIILGNGAAEIINLAVSTLKKPCIVIPSFSEYEISAANNQAEIVFSNLNEDFSCNYNDILDKMEFCDGLVIANPNNPNGAVVDQQAFYPILEFCENNKKRIIMDEAFVEFAKDGTSFVASCKKFKCLFIIRALTKFFAMPGVRLGYGLSCDLEFIEKLCKRQIPWNINTFAELAIKTVLEDNAYINESKIKLETEKAYFYEKLQHFSFINNVYKSEANFLLIKLKEVCGEELFEFALSNGILIRRCSNFRGLDNHFIRLAVKARQHNEQLLRMFENYETQLQLRR
jgi:threonine-phosphate decarboxylase